MKRIESAVYDKCPGCGVKIYSGPIRAREEPGVVDVSDVVDDSVLCITIIGRPREDCHHEGHEEHEDEIRRSYLFPNRLSSVKKPPGTQLYCPLISSVFFVSSVVKNRSQLSAGQENRPESVASSKPW